MHLAQEVLYPVDIVGVGLPQLNVQQEQSVVSESQGLGNAAADSRPWESLLRATRTKLQKSSFWGGHEMPETVPKGKIQGGKGLRT